MVRKTLKYLGLCIGLNLCLVGYIQAETLATQGSRSTHNLQKTKRVIEGTITDVDTEPLIGVSVAISGTSTGTMTDVDGKFSLTAEDGDKIIFSYLGFIQQSIVVSADAVLNIVMQEDNIALDEVVVTALGIRRESKALTYNVQEINAEQLTTVKDANFINSLAGKVAGLRINQSSSGTGGSTRVVMRGEKSIHGDNNALYVIDGIPIMPARNLETINMFESTDGGDADPMTLINPDDIESMSVLTGAASAALYGSRGANGVILITTKKGKEGKLNLSYSNSTQFTNPMIMPKFQNKYGTSLDFYSWGAENTGNANYNPKDFFQTGYNEINSLAVSAGTDKNQTYASIASTISRGIIPNDELNRLNFSVRNTTDLIKNKLRMDIGLTYVTQKDRLQAGQGLYHNPLVPLYLFPRGDDFTFVKSYEIYNPERNLKTQNWIYGNQSLAMQNPYWIVNREKFQNKTDRYDINLGLNYDVLDWLNLMGRARMDNTEKRFQRKISASSDELFASDTGNYMNRKTSYKQVYADVLANVNKRFKENFNLTGTLGASILDNRMEETGFEGHLGMVPNLFTYHNIDLSGVQSKLIQREVKQQTQSLFATAQLGFRSLLYLDVSGRFDWDSALAFASKDKLFYPSVGFSGIITEMIKLPAMWATYIKVRGSYSEVGNAPNPYMTKVLYEMNKGIPNLQTVMPTNLKPEKTKSFELGLEYKALNGRLELDMTYYNANTFNQLLPVEPGSTALYEKFYINSGKVNNWGIEAALGYNHKFGNLGWRTNLTFTFNKNKIKELLPDGTIDPTTGKPMDAGNYVLPINVEGSYKMELREGGTLSDIYVYTLKKDHQGYIEVDPNTGTISADPTNWIKAGQAAPKYNLGWSNSFNYKGFDLGFLFDARIGGVGVSATEALMDRFGVSKRSAEARDNGGVIVNGVRMDAESYYKVVGSGQTGILADYIYSSTNIRLRELNLGYTLPSKWLGGIVNKVNVAFTARNLFFIYNKAPYDPELTSSTGTFFQGFDYFRQPSQRSLGFSVKVEL